jgi:hypothetical protein
MGGFHDRMPLANTPRGPGNARFGPGAAIYGNGVQNCGWMPIAHGIDDLAALVRGLGSRP